MEGAVVVFDFDDTIIDGDSDKWVVDELDLNHLFAQLLPTLPLNFLMDRMMMELHVRGKTIEEIADCLKQVPIDPSIVSAIKSAHASGCDLRILSDANMFFIETILKHHGLLNYFHEIISNPSSVDGEGKLRILPYHDFTSSSHSCNICPPNMCKGLVMERIRASVSAEGIKKKLIYVGDGTPDFCAGLKLEEGDYLIPRKNFPIWEVICTKPMLIKAKIYEWSNWEELASVLIKTTTKTSFIEDKCSTRPDNLVPLDCKIQDSSMSAAHPNALRVPHQPRNSSKFI
ncbi:hypothetical protein FEM48_Zijuj06G0050800 [Ziziphus jujuba var. spinosa]|uniref:Thiamine phosphate phosphatase-like protein n=1 Tax=Ziziphus jujuba var. spinosa TaxID=714518 RepID=A0A978V7B8_ZIZJJ|nr:hypothetical protein FEM48_Zijuj06G0050800 [Ziziphus jujuba var. spinosa]